MRSAVVEIVGEPPMVGIRDEEKSATQSMDSLDLEAIELLTSMTSEFYGGADAPVTNQGSPQLRLIGEQLYRFLDGQEGRLRKLDSDDQGTTLHIPLDRHLRNLPWEAIRDPSTTYLTSRAINPWCITRRIEGAPASGIERPPANRPLRVLFMATAPEDAGVPLNYEIEEQLILDATVELDADVADTQYADTGDSEITVGPRAGVELVVEESGSLAGLEAVRAERGPGYFDVMHLSGHATIVGGVPVFLVEDEVGRAVAASADDIVQAVGGEWPHVVFLSGCLTGGAPDEGLPSLCESLVRQGAPTVIGWALPVGDVAASEYAAQLYGSLAGGERLDRAVATARAMLAEAEQARSKEYWHLLRLYTDGSEMGPLVTRPGTEGRMPPARHRTEAELLGSDAPVKVATRGQFVGRRKVIQRCLRRLRAPTSSADGIELLVLKGMGGLGKSTLAARLIERMQHHQVVSCFGLITDTTASALFGQLDVPEPTTKAIFDELSNEEISRAQQLVNIFTGPLSEVPVLFLFDDLQDGNLTEGQDGNLHELSDTAGRLLSDLCEAIRSSGSSSRILVTSRYEFESSVDWRVSVEGLESFSDVELEKKLRLLKRLGPGSLVSRDLRTRAIKASGRNPRLLETIDASLATNGDANEQVVRNLLNLADDFLTNDVMIQGLLAAQSAEVHRLLAQVGVVRLPIPRETVLAMHDRPGASENLRSAARVGLLEEGTDPETNENRYFLSNLLAPLLTDVLNEDEYKAACAAAARSLYVLWADGSLRVARPPNRRLRPTP